MLHYILQVIAFQLIFLIAFELFLKKETFFSYNRAYLLITPVLSMLLPLLKIPMLQSAIPAETLVMLPEVFIGANHEAQTSIASNPATPEAAQSINWWLLAYGAGFLFSLGIFFNKFRILRRLFAHKPVLQDQEIKIVEVPQTKVACTFYNTIFLGTELSENEREQILSHEIVHVRQRHTLDLLFFEFLKIVFWFNPLIYIYQSRISACHEFLADAGVVKKVEKRTYFEQLLNSAFNTEDISFINQFFNHSIIKKRIVMLQKSRSKSTSKFKFLIILPLMLAMLTYVACSEDSGFAGENAVEVSQDDEALKKVLKEELIQMEKDGAEFMEIANAFMTEKDAHIKSKEAYYRFAVYSEHIMEKSAERQMAEGNFDADDVKQHEEMLEKIRNRTYDQYVAYRKTVAEKPAKTTITEVQFEGESDVPFVVVDNVPVFPGCEGVTTNAERKDCLSGKISEFINSEFNTSLGKELGLKGVNRIYVQFRIGKDGAVEVLGARAPHPVLQEEAERVVNLLPQMTPGEHKGEKVGVLYSLPISFDAGE